jgi:hypothetical protein
MLEQNEIDSSRYCAFSTDDITHTNVDGQLSGAFSLILA